MRFRLPSQGAGYKSESMGQQAAESEVLVKAHLLASPVVFNLHPGHSEKAMLLAISYFSTSPRCASPAGETGVAPGIPIKLPGSHRFVVLEPKGGLWVHAMRDSRDFRGKSTGFVWVEPLRLHALQHVGEVRREAPGIGLMVLAMRSDGFRRLLARSVAVCHAVIPVPPLR